MRRTPLSAAHPALAGPAASRRPTFDHLLAVTALALVASTLAGFLGTSWWVFDLLANLRWHLAVLLAAVTIASLLARRWTVALLTLAGAAINLIVVAPLLIGAPGPTSAPDAASLEVTFFNAKIRADKDAVIAYLEDRDDDVIVLAGTDRSWVEAMAASGLPLHVVSGGHLDPGLEILVMARRPDAEVTAHKLTDHSRDVLVEVVIEGDGGPVHLLGTHPVSPKTPGRAQRRDLMLDWIGSWSSRRDAPVVVMGDLNATPWSASFETMLDQGGLIDSQQRHGIQPSWPAALGRLGLPIDHVLHSGELTTLERELGPSFGSDHRMVHARLARHSGRG